MNGLFLYLADKCGLSAIDDLLPYVQRWYLYPNSERLRPDDMFSPATRRLLVAYERDQSAEPVTDLSVFSIQPPNRLICLSHWRVLTMVLMQLPADVQKEVLLVEDPHLQSGLLSTWTSFSISVRWYPFPS